MLFLLPLVAGLFAYPGFSGSIVTIYAPESLPVLRETGKIPSGNKKPVSFYYSMEIAIILILILLNGLFALSEIAMVSVKRSRIEQKAQNGDRNARILREPPSQPENLLSPDQVESP